MKIHTKSNFSSQKRIYFGKREGRAGGYGAALMMAINALHVEQKAIEETGKAVAEMVNLLRAKVIQ